MITPLGYPRDYGVQEESAVAEKKSAAVIHRTDGSPGRQR